MRIKARNYLFIITRNKINDLMKCRECGSDLKLGELIYSKRKQKYYCTIKLGHLTRKTIKDYIEVTHK